MAEKTIKGICRTCKKDIEVDLPVGYSAICAFCSEYLHNCLHCKFYDPQKLKCNAQVSELPKSANAKNFCDDYSFSPSPTPSAKPSNIDDSKKKLANLFKDKLTDDDKPKKSIHDLFKDK